VLDAEAEQVAESSGVAAAGDRLVEDAVRANSLDAAGETEGEEDPAAADGLVAVRGSEVDEQVRVGRCRPALLAEIAPGPDTASHWLSARDEAGSVSALVAVVALGLVMVAGLAYDGGRIIAAQATARDLASGAARAGAQEIDLTELRDTGTPLLDPDRAAAAAEAYLARTGHSGRVRVEGTAITVAVDVDQPMVILPLPARTITAVHTATALTGPVGDG
jgi:hypothetical protein